MQTDRELLGILFISFDRFWQQTSTILLLVLLLLFQSSILVRHGIKRRVVIA